MKRTLMLLTFFTLQPLVAMEPNAGKRPKIGQSDEFSETTIVPFPPAMPTAQELQPTSENLFKAIQESNPERCEWLINHGVDVNSRNQDNETALICAAQQGQEELCKLLLTHNADTSAQNRFGETALAFACEHGHLKTCQTLIAYGADVHAQPADGLPIVQYAAIRGHEQICKLLLDHGANPNALGINGMPTLIECIKNEYATDEQIFKCVKILLKYGADVNLLSTGRPIDYSRNAQNEGSTALMEAISWRSRRLCELLLQWGADYEYQNNQKESAITRAQDVEIFEIEDIDHMITLLTNPNIRHGVMIRPDNPILQQGFGNDANNIPRALLKRELGKK